jgi:DUF1680 family protein
MTQLNRRHFLGVSTACTCGLAAGSSAFAATALPKPAVTPKLSQFHHGEVQLLDSPLRTQFDYQHDLYVNLDPDMLLKPFRVRSGLPAPGADMGGWYDSASDFDVEPGSKHPTMHGFVPGHTFGQYISGLSRDYAITGDPATKARITLLVDEYAKTLSPKFFDDYNLPAYTYDKLVVGLMDAWYYAGVAEAKPTLDKLTDIALPYLPERALNRIEMRERPHKRVAQGWDESYTMPENLFLAYSRGMGERYRAMAIRYIEDETYFSPLAEGVNPFANQHAYSHVNGLSSAMQSYLVLGDDHYLTAAKNGFAFIEAQSYATGGWGPNETLMGANDTGRLYDSLKDVHASFETPCGAYGHFKITRYLLRTTGDSHYGDSMERVLYNTILGAKPTLPDGTTFYYSDYNETAKKGYHPDKWPCCSGTFIQLTADYGISAYLFDAKALYVNLYIPSKVQATLGGRKVILTQTTDYPKANTTKLAIGVDTYTPFTLALRIPAWAGPKTAILINGRPVSMNIAPGHFAELTRVWEPDDTVELVFDMTPRLEPLNAAHPEMVALMTGPLVLFPINDAGPPLTREDWLGAQAQTPDTWVVHATDRTVTLKPFMAITDETYRLYSPLKTA